MLTCIPLAEFAFATFQVLVIELMCPERLFISWNHCCHRIQQKTSRECHCCSSWVLCGGSQCWSRMLSLVPWAPLNHSSLCYPLPHIHTPVIIGLAKTGRYDTMTHSKGYYHPQSLSSDSIIFMFANCSNEDSIYVDQKVKKWGLQNWSLFCCFRFTPVFLYFQGLPLESVHGHPSHFPEGLVFLSLSTLVFLPGIDLDLLQKFSVRFLWLTPETFFCQTFKSWDKDFAISLIGQRKPFAILGVSRLGHFHQCVPGLPPLSQMPLDWLSNVLSSSESSLSTVVISNAHPTHIFQSALPTVTQGLRTATVTANVSPAVTQDTYMWLKIKRIFFIF